MTPWSELPPGLGDLRGLVLDLRWTWSHEADALWARIDNEAWTRTRNPWTVLRGVSARRLAELARDDDFVSHVRQLAASQRAYLTDPGWFASTALEARPRWIGYFSMEFGLADALPLYAGGLGVLAGDLLKAASDLGVPVTGVGLLYQEGYFRQMIDADGQQQETYPFNDPADMPIEPVRTADGDWLNIPVELPGRTVRLRIWRAIVGRSSLYLMDSNDPVNGPVDRGILGKLYPAATETRLMQEVILGVGGWRLLEALHPETEICHLNEGHAGFAVLERARRFARAHGLTFAEAMWATRAGNVFTTHTPVSSGFDRFPVELVERYLRVWAAGDDINLAEVRQLGVAPDDPDDGRFNMAWLAARGAARSFAVSRLHGQVSRRIFQPLYPRWPESEVPFDHITNGVHVPTWDSAAADAVWTEAGGKDRWRHEPEDLPTRIESASDAALWTLRGSARDTLVRYVRERLAVQLRGRGHPPEVVERAETVLDPNVLTMGFARRFTSYKRPDLLLFDRDRFSRLIRDTSRPVQLVLAGKAHPEDLPGKHAIQQWIAFAGDPRHRGRVVFLEDYDIALAQELVAGVDVWINTPRRPWEACGTSGMKTLVNGGLNVSTLDGWWEEAYAPGVGWVIGDSTHASESEQDHADADELLTLLERDVVPAFYDRDAIGMPRAWLARMRRSMTELTVRYTASRMVRECLEKAYLPAVPALRARSADAAAAARSIAAWDQRLRRGWPAVHIGETDFVARDAGAEVSVPVYLGDIAPEAVRVEICADTTGGAGPEAIELTRAEPVLGATGGYFYRGRIAGTRPAEDYTVRAIPRWPGVLVPAETALIRWRR